MTPETDTDTDSTDTEPETGHNPPNLQDGWRIVAYSNPEVTIPVGSHSTREVAVDPDAEPNVRVMFECADCGITSNSITRFVQDPCSGDGGQR